VPDPYPAVIAWINAATRSAATNLYRVLPEDSARSGWHRVICEAHPDCDWSGTGLEATCDDAGYGHVDTAHSRGPLAVDVLVALTALRALAVAHKPTPSAHPDGHVYHWGCAGCDKAYQGQEGATSPCSNLEMLAHHLGVGMVA
jgi:hypothetical protein